MAFSIQLDDGRTIRVNSCLTCGATETNGVICQACRECPRCGATASLADHAANPVLFRCLCCLSGWLSEVVAVEGVLDDRPEEQLAFFARSPPENFDVR